MKNSGKYQKQTKTKQPQVKSLLLQTYFTSLLCLVLSVSMFFGTSYAWFTSEVESRSNEIYVGTLNVGLFKVVNGSEGETEYDLADKNKLFDGTILWEPGYTSLDTIRIRNEGNLAFQYVLNFTDGNLEEGRTKSLEEVAKCFDVWIFDHAANTQTKYTKPDSYDKITATGSGWENPGTLDKFLSGEFDLSGKLYTEDQVKSQQAKNKIVEREHSYTIALHMREDVTPDVMGHKISLSVKLVAYQMTTEADGLGNTNYDNIAAVSNADDLKKALGNANNILLTSDIVISDAAERRVMQGGVLDGNGNTISYTGGKQGDSSVGVLTTNGGTISNLTVKGGDNGRALYITDLTSNLVVSNCYFSGAYAFNINSAKVTDYTISFTDTYFETWTSYANVMEHAYFTNCTFANILKPYGATTLTDCKFAIEGLNVSALESGESITLINCTYKDITIDKAVVTRQGVEGTEAITINADGLVVLSTNP